MILYFADRRLNILGQASTGLPKGMTVVDDLKTEDVETGVAVFDCTLAFDKESRNKAEACAAVGNYLLRSNGDESELYTIIDFEFDTKKQEVYIYAEDAGLDLLNEVVGAYEADKAYPISHYIEKFAYDSGFVIGINEIDNLTLQLSWDDEETATARIADVAAKFGGAEISYSYAVNGLTITQKYINIHQKRGKDNGVQLRLNYEVDKIVTKKSIASLATAFRCTGGTPDNADNPITLSGYSYDDGDFYVAGDLLCSREAYKQWSRYLWKDEPNQATDENDGHIIKTYDYDTTSQAELCAQAIAELKKVREIEVNYQIEGQLPDGVKIGDTVYVVDDAGGLYLSTRVLQLETSVVNKKQKTTLGEYLIKGSGISQKVADLAAQFAKNTVSVKRALSIANNAKTAAEAAQEQANAAAEEAEAAQGVADEAKTAADAATQSAAAATEAATNAQAAVDIVEKSVEELQTTVDNAQAAADNAQLAANTATEKAEEAKTAADNAVADAEEAKTNSEAAQSVADSAIAKAETAESTAADAVATAEAASTTAAAAKADAEQAEKDVAALGENLNTLESTMQADYARKTELTETEAHLQSQITQNAEQITSTVEQVTKIDETANNAADLASQAQSKADTAQQQADQATADAQAAQTAANNAAQAAANAQSEADTAKAAAATAQGVADKAEADLDAAKADLATVTSRVDATEEEIATAQAAVEAAQSAADKAKADATTAAEKAAEAQTTANTAVTNAANAQSAADDAANKANLAQQAADEAKGNAAAAQAKANEAAEAAAAAQATADTAKTNATNAQATADQAAADALAAQQAADDADAKAAQAASDLATAQQNLADVTSRVDATEEEVAAAQAAVTTAQEAADKAKEDAEAAQATADTAKANAATAQAAADNAKTAADNAQKAADDAQDAADKAQADVDALAVRVTKAETDIVQTAEKITLLATKEEVTETLGGYYTKEETDAAIEVSAEGVKTTVRSEITEAVDGVEVGGRNLLTGSDAEMTGTDEFMRYMDIAPIIDEHGLIEYTISFDIKSADTSKQTTMQVYCQNGSGAKYRILTADSNYINVPVTTEYTRQSAVFTPSISSDTETESWLAFYGGYDTGNIPTIKNVKIEKGNKATDWTPAPEDLEEATQNAQDTADATAARVTIAESTIQQLADAIAMLVTDENGASLMTQTADGGWTFSIADLSNAISSNAESVDALTGELGNANSAIDTLQQAVSDLGVTADYVRITKYNDQPCIELGESENDFKVRITNTEIQFADGTTIPAKINRQMLIIEKAMIKSELQFGDDEDLPGVWIWKMRSNGNLGLMWKEVTN